MLLLLALLGCHDTYLSPPTGEAAVHPGRVSVLDPVDLAEGVLFEEAEPFRSLIVAVAADPETTFQLRAEEPDGRWTAWEELTFDEVLDDVRTGVIVLDEPRTAIEVRADGPVSFAQLEAHAGEVPTFDDDQTGEVPSALARAHAGWWEPPADVWGVGQTQYLPYTYATYCSGGARPGAVALADWLRASFAASSYGIYSCRSIVGGSGMSVHSEGRAIDLFVPVDAGAGYPSDADNDAGDPIAHFLMQNAEAIGVSYFIWDRGSWGAHRSGDKHGYYSGSHPHNDHLHIELTPTAAETLTTALLDGLGGKPTNDWIALAATPASDGYWVAREDGSVQAFGAAPSVGDLTGLTLAAPVVDAVADPDGGLWLATADGGVFALGGASFHGSMGGVPLAAPVVGMAPTPSGDGYWLVGEDGGIFAFGDAGFHGSMGGVPLNGPVVGIAATPSGGGYWLAGDDGGIFAFGDAGFHGSMGGQPLAAPVTGVAATPGGRGYWLVAEDGGVFSFGDAPFQGSMGGQPLAAPVADLTPGGWGYWMVGRDGGVFTFGVPFHGAMP